MRTAVTSSRTPKTPRPCGLALLQQCDDPLDQFVDVSAGCVECQVRVLRRLVRRVDSGEPLQFTRPRTCVQALGISTFAFFDGSGDGNFEESEPGSFVESARNRSIRTQRRNHRRDRHHATAVGEQSSEMPDASDVLGSVSRREPEIVGDTVADVVTVQEIRGASRVDERTFDSDCDGGFSGGRQAGQPDRRALLGGRRPPPLTFE